MNTKQNTFTLACFLILTGVVGCGKNSDVAQNQNVQPPVADEPAAPPSLLSGWNTFSSEPGNFSLLLPNEPKSKEQQMGRLALHAFAAQKDIQNAFGVAYCDFPKTPDAKSVFNEIQNATAGNQTSIVFQQDVKVGNYPAHEFEFVKGGKANYSVRERMILVGQRLYLLNVIFLTSNPHPDERDAYFKSFSLLKN